MRSLLFRTGLVSVILASACEKEEEAPAPAPAPLAAEPGVKAGDQPGDTDGGGAAETGPLSPLPPAPGPGPSEPPPPPPPLEGEPGITEVTATSATQLRVKGVAFTGSVEVFRQAGCGGAAAGTGAASAFAAGITVPIPFDALAGTVSIRTDNEAGVSVCTAAAAFARAPASIGALAAAATADAGLYSREVVTVGGAHYFPFDGGDRGIELHKLQGDTVSLVKDINPAGSSSPSLLTAVGDTIYFAADDGRHGPAVWRSDGTASGTSLFFDAAPTATYSYVSGLAAAGGNLLIAADGVLYVSVAGGTPTSVSGLSGVGALTASAGKIYFAATDVTNGTEPHVSDGTAAGTALLKNIGAGGSNSSPVNFVTYGSEVLFQTQTPGQGSQFDLWRSDGTDAGTFKVKGGIPCGFMGSCTYFPPRVVGTDIYFSSTMDFSSYSLWKSNGTADNGAAFANVGAYGLDLVPLGSKIHFVGEVGGTLGLWSSDGTGPGTAVVKAGNPLYPAAAGGKIFFTLAEGGLGTEPWVSDGTGGGTARLADLRTGARGSSPTFYAALGGRAAFVANDGVSGARLFLSDGTGPGTIQPASARSDTIAGPTALVGGRYVFAAGDHLYSIGRNDATATDLGALPTMPARFWVAGPKAFFILAETDGTQRVWRTDGTPAGTFRIDAAVAVYYAETQATATSTHLYFVGSADGFSDLEVWRSDGTELGTVAAADIAAGGDSSGPDYLTTVGERVIFTAYDVNYVTQLYGVDAAGVTQLTTDSGIAYSYYADAPVVMGGRAFFAIASGADGLELWRSDGTLAGTAQVLDISSTGDSAPTLFTVAGSILYFLAADDMGQMGLYASDGTAGGTQRLRDMGYDPSLPRAALGNLLIFAYDDAASNAGTELWVSNGSIAGTTLLKDINPGADSTAFPALGLGTTGNKLVFAAGDAAGVRIWSTDGTAAGTSAIADAAPTAGATPTPTPAGARFGTKLVFAASAGAACGVYVTEGTAATTTLVSTFPGSSCRARTWQSDATAGEERLWLTAPSPTGHAVLRY